MKLNSDQIGLLLNLIQSSKDDDLDCDSCYEQLSEFVESELEGKELPEAMTCIRNHLDQCNCCCEEYEMLLAGVREFRRRDEATPDA